MKLATKLALSLSALSLFLSANVFAARALPRSVTWNVPTAEERKTDYWRCGAIAAGCLLRAFQMEIDQKTIDAKCPKLSIVQAIVGIPNEELSKLKPAGELATLLPAVMGIKNAPFAAWLLPAFLSKMPLPNITPTPKALAEYMTHLAVGAHVFEAVSFAKIPGAAAGGGTPIERLLEVLQESPVIIQIVDGVKPESVIGKTAQLRYVMVYGWNASTDTFVINDSVGGKYGLTREQLRLAWDWDPARETAAEYNPFLGGAFPLLGLNGNMAIVRRGGTSPLRPTRVEAATP